MTNAIIATETDAAEFMARVEAGAERRRAAKAATAARQAKAQATRDAKAAAQLALAMAQYERDVAATPTTIIYNPSTKNYDAYWRGELVAQAGTYLDAEAARLALVTRAMDGPAGDLAVTQVIETDAGDVAVAEVVLAPIEEEATMDERGYVTESKPEWFDFVPCEICKGGPNHPFHTRVHPDDMSYHPYLPVEIVAEEATMDKPTDEREVVAVEQAGTGEFAPSGTAAAMVAAALARPYDPDRWQARMCHLCDQAVREARCEVPGMGMVGLCRGCVALVQGAAPAADPHQAPAPLPTCDLCGGTCAQHNTTWCGCIPANAPAGSGPGALLVDRLPPFVVSSLASAMAANDAADLDDVNSVDCAACFDRGGWEENGKWIICYHGDEPPPPAPSASDPAPCLGCDDAGGWYEGGVWHPCGHGEGAPTGMCCGSPCVASCLHCGEGMCATCVALLRVKPCCPVGVVYTPCDHCGRRGEKSCNLCGAVFCVPCIAAQDGLCVCQVDSLPFTPTDADRAEALADLEAAAGVTADEPPVSELALQFAEIGRRLVEWEDLVANGGDVVAARRVVIDGMLAVERFAGLKAIPAVVGLAA
jgi:hypothetical protein